MGPFSRNRGSGDTCARGTSAWTFSATVISFYASNAASFPQAWVAKLADATDLKSVDPKGSCGFDSRPRHHKLSNLALRGSSVSMDHNLALRGFLLRLSTNVPFAGYGHDIIPEDLHGVVVEALIGFEGPNSQSSMQFVSNPQEEPA